MDKIWTMLAPVAAVVMVSPALQAQEPQQDAKAAVQLLMDKLQLRNDRSSELYEHCSQVLSGQETSLRDYAWLPNLMSEFRYEKKVSEDTLIEVAKALIAAGADVNARTPKGKNVLYYVGDKPKLARVLLAAGADVNARSNSQETPLHTMLSPSEEEVFEVLIEAGADIRARDNAGRTPLHNAFCCSSEKSRSRLIALGADVNAENHNGVSPLDIAINDKKLSVVMEMMEAGGKMNPAKYSPLFQACFFGQVDTCRELLDAGASANESFADGENPIILAVSLGHVDLCRLLVKYGADVASENQSGDTLLHIAACNDRPEACAMLLELGADAEALNDDGYTPLALAVKHVSPEAVDALLAGGAKMNVNCDRMTVLMMAVEEDAAILKKLLAAGADPNMAARGSGETPMHRAAGYGKNEAVKLLLDAGANVNAVDYSDTTPLVKACQYSSSDVDLVTTLKLLLAAGADVHLTHRGGLELVDHVSRWQDESRRVAMLELLLDAGAAANGSDKLASRFFVSLVKNGDFALIHKVINSGMKPRGWRPLCLAALLGDVQEVKNQLAVKPELKVKLTSHGNTPLVYAAYAGHAEVCRLLLDAGASTALKTQNMGWSPLTAALISGNKEVVDMLLAAGADATEPNSMLPPLLAAAMAKDEATAQALCESLLKAGADVKTTNSMGRNALHCALYSHPDMNINSPLCKFLISAGCDPKEKDRFGDTPEELPASHRIINAWEFPITH